MRGPEQKVPKNNRFLRFWKVPRGGEPNVSGSGLASEVSHGRRLFEVMCKKARVLEGGAACAKLLYTSRKIYV